MARNEDAKNLIIARLETLNPDTKILLMGEKGRPITVRDMIDEVRRDSEFGKKIVNVQLSYIKMLASGEIDV